MYLLEKTVLDLSKDDYMEATMPKNPDGQTKVKRPRVTTLFFLLKKVIIFSIWLRNRIISAGLEPVFSHTEKLYLASYYRQFLQLLKYKQ